MTIQPTSTMRDESRAEAQFVYSITAFDFVANPIGSRDWELFWRGWQAGIMSEASRASAPDDRKDAERYRWLRAMRDPDLCVRGEEQRTRGYEPDYYRAAITEMALDAAIDAAMQENPNG